jgi:hypothetical protein
MGMLGKAQVRGLTRASTKILEANSGLKRAKMFVGTKRSATGQGLRLGEILVDAGVVKSELVNQSLAIAKNTKMPIGRVLISHGHLSDLVIKNAIEAQQGVRDGRYTREYATKLIKTAYGSNVSIEQADALIAWDRAYKTSFSELGKFLLAAGIVAEDHLWSAHTESKQEGAPIGAWLAEKNTISAELMSDALKIMVLCREGRLSRSAAILLLQKIYNDNLTLEEASQAMGLTEIFEEKRVRLAELMVDGGLMNTATALEAIEISMERKQMLGQVLVEEGLISSILLDASVHLQEMVNLGILVRTHAAELLATVKRLEMPLDDVLCELERKNKIARFVFNCGLVSEKDKAVLFERGKSMDINLGTELMKSGLINDKVIGFASYFYQLIESSAISVDEATGVMHYCLRYKLEPAQAMTKLGLQLVPQWATADKELQYSA